MRPGRDLGSLIGTSLLAGATTWVAVLAWRGFTQTPALFLGPLFTLALLIAGVGALLRWLRVPGWGVFPAQVLAAGLATSALLGGSLLPLGTTWDRLTTIFADALASAAEYAAPVPASVPSVHPLLVVGGVACLLLVDLLACTLRRTPLAGLPLLAIYAVPISVLGDGVSWWIFVGTTAGFLALLFLQESENVARWGRPLGTEPLMADDAGFGVSTGAIRGSAGAIGSVATAMAVVLPLFIPTLQLAVFDFGQGPGGTSKIEITNPMTDLRRDLVQPRDVPLVQLTTDDPDPSYLRISVLNRFSGNEWSSGDRDVPPAQLANGDLPPLVGVSAGVNRTSYTYSMSVFSNFSSLWLPTMTPATRVTAPGPWLYDTSTMDFIAGSRGLTTAGLRYTMTGVDLDLSAVDLARSTSSSGLVGSEFTELPPGLPTSVRNIANVVTRDAGSRFEKAVALQEWFREDGGFSYDTSIVAGNGTDELVAFLADTATGRTGYCEQFASAYAVLARVLGIPARVAVGFLSPSRLGPQTWQYSSRDLHAWPELFFAGAGWVRFEPTPAGRAEDVPSYTTERVPSLPTALPSTSQPSDLLPDRGASSATPSESALAGAGASTGSGFPWPWLVAGLTGTVLVGLLLLVPRAIRSRRRTHRLGRGVEAAWAELRDTAIDLGVPWPHGRSPRETRDQLVEHFGAPLDRDSAERPAHGPAVAPEAVQALDRVVHQLELLRYSQHGVQHDDADSGLVRSDLAQCLVALVGGAPRSARRRAQWWPQSVVSTMGRSEAAGDAESTPTPFGGVVDHVG